MKADSMHRLAKLFVDSGEAPTVEDAWNTLRGYGMRLRLGPSIEHSVSQQMIALTAVNAAARSFLGNVAIEGIGDVALTARGYRGVTLREAAAEFGVRSEVGQDTNAWPVVCIGDARTDPAVQRIVVPWANGWSFGVGGVVRSTHDDDAIAPACVAAGGLAVSEVFSMLRQDNSLAGHREVAFSLWSMTPGVAVPAERLDDMLRGDGAWLIGLGHLGQAYAWTLGFMKPDERFTLMLQDVDAITPSNLSTSLISMSRDVGQLKTRAAAAWLEQRGYATRIVERRFDALTRIGSAEPTLALFGVDNAAARRACELAGFRLVVDAGLGAGVSDFRSFRMRTFPGPSAADRLWAGDLQDRPRAGAPAYVDLLRRGLDACGVTTLAGRAVGASFVGCVTAGFVIAECLRRQIGNPGCAYVDGTLRELHHLECA